MMTDDEIVDFVRKYPCAWNNAFMGWAYRFDAPFLKNKRAPFTSRRLNRLIEEGRVVRVEDSKPGDWWTHGHLEVPR